MEGVDLLNALCDFLARTAHRSDITITSLQYDRAAMGSYDLIFRMHRITIHINCDRGEMRVDVSARERSPLEYLNVLGRPFRDNALGCGNLPEPQRLHAVLERIDIMITEMKG